MKNGNIRPATKADAQVIVELIRQLADYEKLSHEAVMTPELIEKNVFENGYAHVLLVEENEAIIGFALYFFNFSTFLGKPGLYLEDLFIEPQHRGKGYGKQLLIELARIAVEKECGRMEWIVLDWNTPSIEFYKSLGAFPLDEWAVYRLTEDKMRILASADRK
ncbi:GNAT family N-acetyltransferase [Crocinitomicaceae bacterium CZZ-1]|uniref:GNAT family N-acetyltransferase n=1 Tax=Taishania pollutisoli TaxID=2766479 RepID=A0A8J6P702_9FLAO|nr:GNAT family N-acetyltransferase [Taishania pollutisoli]MBC9813159.1 GNAT family N-acetyltransferase [Taishania pollutisoli]NGF76399.1 GNAT family N-acetyltransferase [Fluviicola sp. SGL-29]